MINTNPFPFSDRIKNIPESFIREILKVSSKPHVISFAGGLPNPDFFPAAKIAMAAEKVLSKDGSAALQYWVSEGYLPLRDYIAHRHSAKTGVTIRAEDVLMLNGSQQGLDLAGKLFLNPSSNLLMEGPSYLGAIQAFSVYQPVFHHLKIFEGGPDIGAFSQAVKKVKPVAFYCIPNFQNPTGNTYDMERRQGLAAAMEKTNTLCIEDNPYGDIYFEKNGAPDFYALIPDKNLHLGSFSKIVSPGMRLGWATGPTEIMKKMTVAKQAADLHTSNLMQRIVFQFLLDNSLEDHLTSIRSFYKGQAEFMMSAMRSHFPKEVRWIIPKGGMFIWATLPESLRASALLKKAMDQNVLFVPGENFYADGNEGSQCLRMNFSNPSKMEITKGVKILGELIHTMMNSSES